MQLFHTELEIKNIVTCLLSVIMTLSSISLSVRKFSGKTPVCPKRGSRALRCTLMNAAHNAVKNNATFKAYYDAKSAKGRTTHYNAL